MITKICSKKATEREHIITKKPVTFFGSRICREELVSGLISSTVNMSLVLVCTGSRSHEAEKKHSFQYMSS